MPRETRDLAALTAHSNKKGSDGGELLRQSLGRKNDARKGVASATAITPFDKEVSDAARRREANAKREKALALRQGRMVSKYQWPRGGGVCTKDDWGMVLLPRAAG